MKSKNFYQHILKLSIKHNTQESNIPTNFLQPEQGYISVSKLTITYPDVPFTLADTYVSATTNNHKTHPITTIMSIITKKHTTTHNYQKMNNKQQTTHNHQKTNNKQQKTHNHQKMSNDKCKNKLQYLTDKTTNHQTI